MKQQNGKIIVYIIEIIGEKDNKIRIFVTSIYLVNF